MKLADLDCFASLDWGYNAPGCCLWWLCLADSHYHVLREFKFQRMTVGEAGLEIVKRTKALGIRHLRYVVADPACWQHTGAGKGEAIAETLARAPIRLPMKKGDNDRKNGWQRIHELFQPAPDGTPWLTIDESCTYLRRTIPAAVSEEADLDDLDTTGDDHGLDSLRYGAMSRPAPSRFSTVKVYSKNAVGKLFQRTAEEAARSAA
jgi:hypothetical protein